MIEEISKFYTQDIIVMRRSASKTDIGGLKRTYAPHLSFKGLIRPLGGAENRIGDKPTLVATFRLYCAPCDIAQTDRIYNEAEPTVMYEVKYPNDVMNMGNHLQVDLEMAK